MNCSDLSSFSEKQIKLLTWWTDGSPYRGCDAVICDGSVRSGKTLCMALSFLFWAFFCFSDRAFALCGKTITSLRRNLVIPILPILRELGFACIEKLSQNYILVRKGGRENRFHLFGGRDEGSAALIQGVTLAGILLDEAALMPRSFCEQAIARCSVEGSKLWFNCNPENPAHWFYREWVEKAGEKNGYRLHFTMEDNPSLSPAMRSRYEKLYSGAFYERFVKGRWVAAEGLVYPFFGADFIYEAPQSLERFYVSCDYGTVNPTSMGLWGEKDGTFFRVAEFYHDSKQKGFQMTDEEYYGSLASLIGGRKVDAVIVDPSAASFIECIKRHGQYRVMRADNDVLKGIRRTSDALKSGRIKICRPCKDALREFSLYCWDEHARYDLPRRENDHAMDDIRYFVMSIPERTDDGFFAVSVER